MLTYDQAVAKLGKRESKKLENNTYLRRAGEGALAVELHGTAVVTIRSDGTYVLNTGGWRTVTTKDRINGYSPARVYSKNGVWYVGDYLFEDGMVIGSDGAPVNPDENEKRKTQVERAKRKVDKLVKAYVKGYAEHYVRKGVLSAPGPGDCFGCYFEAHDEPIEGPMGIDHIISHMIEGYYVPSLLWRAIRARGYRDPAFIWAMINTDLERGEDGILGDGDRIKEVLRAYFRKLKGKLIESMMGDLTPAAS